MDDLDYKKHLEHYKCLFGYYVDNPHLDKIRILRDADEEAKYDHALCVFNPLRDWIHNAVQIAKKLNNENARYYMLYGAGRRINMTFRGYQEIMRIAYNKRSEPLSHDEQSALSQEINIIYMNLRGILDNFAWCLLYERQPELADKIDRNDVGLFSKRFRKHFDAYSEIDDEIKVHSVWHHDVKERCDPVAHRIPLYVPPALITQEEAKTYSPINDHFNDSLERLKLDEAGDKVKCWVCSLLGIALPDGPCCMRDTLTPSSSVPSEREERWSTVSPTTRC